MIEKRQQRLFRLAPTPSGYLHWGNVFSFLWTSELARQAEGKMLLRIDDFDGARSKIEFQRNVFEVLEFLEIQWDLGPKNLEEALSPRYSQYQRMPQLIEEFWELMGASKGQTYVCDCSKSSLQSRVASEASPTLRYDGFCRKRELDFQDGCGVRLKVANPEAGTGDAWLLRRDGVLAYQWVSLVEDLRWRVTDIIRGMDLLDSTHFQQELACALVKMGHSQFESFAAVSFQHHPLLSDASQIKLSKNRKDLSFLDDVKKRGLKREDVWGQFCEWKQQAAKEEAGN